MVLDTLIKKIFREGGLFQLKCYSPSLGGVTSGAQAGIGSREHGRIHYSLACSLWLTFSQLSDTIQNSLPRSELGPPRSIYNQQGNSLQT